MSTDAPLIFLSFGRVSDADTARREEGRLVAAKGGGLGRQVALVAPDTPAFRLNTPGWLVAAPELIMALDSRAMLRTLCRDRLLAAVPPFSARTRRVVEAYLDRIGELAGEPPDKPDGVTDPTDRYFSALLPMPNAHIQPVRTGRDGLAAAGGQEPVRVDLAFWDGSTLTAIVFGGAGSRLPRQSRALAALKDALGPRLALHEIDGITRSGLDGIVPQHVLDVVIGSAGPVYGPYRAPEFSLELPDPAHASEH